MNIIEIIRLAKEQGLQISFYELHNNMIIEVRDSRLKVVKYVPFEILTSMREEAANKALGFILEQAASEVIKKQLK